MFPPLHISYRKISKKNRNFKVVRTKRVLSRVAYIDYLSRDICDNIYKFLDLPQCCQFARLSKTIMCNVAYYKQNTILSQEDYKHFITTERENSPFVLSHMLKYHKFFIKFLYRKRYWLCPDWNKDSTPRSLYALLVSGKLYGTRCESCSRYHYSKLPGFHNLILTLHSEFSEWISDSRSEIITEYEYEKMKSTGAICLKSDTYYDKKCCYGLVHERTIYNGDWDGEEFLFNYTTGNWRTFFTPRKIQTGCGCDDKYRKISKKSDRKISKKSDRKIFKIHENHWQKQKSVEKNINRMKFKKPLISLYW